MKYSGSSNWVVFMVKIIYHIWLPEVTSLVTHTTQFGGDVLVVDQNYPISWSSQSNFLDN